MLIYEIRNKVNNHCYIGQTIFPMPFRRFNVHRHNLRNNKHRNIHLQRAWNKYKEKNFDFKVIEICNNRKELNTAERKHIRLRGYYNICSGGQVNIATKEIMANISAAKRPQGYPPIVDPNGKIWKIEPSLEAFAKLHKLPAPGLRYVIYGKNAKSKIYHCKGWHLVNKKSLEQLRSETNRTKEYPDVIGPDNKEYKINNLRQFVKQHNLNRRHFQLMLRGDYQQHKGWHIKGNTIIDPNSLRSQKTKRNKWPNVLDPTGKVYTIDIMNRFVREHHLDKHAFRNMLKGKFKQHKGWKLI